MKKKLISLLLLSFVWVLALCACGSRQAEVEQTPAVPVESTAPTLEPTESPMPASTPAPTLEPTTEPTLEPTPVPTAETTAEPIAESTIAPSKEPEVAPKPAPSEIPEPKGSTEPVTSSVDQIPEFDLAAQEPSSVIGDGVTGIDPDDPYYGYAGYEGPKEGYVFVPNIGYREKSENDRLVNNLKEAANSEINYFDFTGHQKAYHDLGEPKGPLDYEAWVKDNMDYVNQICEEWGISFEKYMEYNHNLDFEVGE